MTYCQIQGVPLLQRTEVIVPTEVEWGGTVIELFAVVI